MVPKIGVEGQSVFYAIIVVVFAYTSETKLFMNLIIAHHIILSGQTGGVMGSRTPNFCVQGRCVTASTMTPKWLEDRDSNPDKQIQSLLSYR